MYSLLTPLSRLPEIQETLSRLKQGGSATPVAISGLSGVHKAHFAAYLRAKSARPILILCPDELEAARMRADVSALAMEEAYLLRDRDFVFYPVETVSRQWEQERLPVLHRMLIGAAPIVVTTPDALIQRTLPPKILRENVLTLKPGTEIAPEILTEALLAAGYKQADIVEGVGQFARRGGIMDFFSPGEAEPVRVEFFGDEVDTLSSIDLQTHRRSAPLSAALLLPCMETLPHAAPGGLKGLIAAMRNHEDADRLRDTGYLAAIDRYLALIYPELTTALDYLPRKTIVITSESARLSERLKNLLWQQGQDLESLLESGALSTELAVLTEDAEGLWSALGSLDVLALDTFAPSSYPLRPHAILSVLAKQLPSFGASLETALSDVRQYSAGMAVILTQSERRVKILDEMLREHEHPALRADLGPEGEAPPEGTVALCVGSLSAGLEYPSLGFAILTEGQGAAAPRKKQGHSTVPKSNRQRLASYTDLSPGDLVVHEHHGIGRFVGIVAMVVDGLKRDYIKLAYAGTDSLYVPVTQLNLVSKYIGQHSDEPDGKGPRLNKLGGADWGKAKSKAKAAAKILAQGLIDLYAQRKRQEGTAFPADSDWQMAFEEKFEYQETEDQIRSVREIKADMESPYPMDRLLCGEVGFGKTEVALRAAMKCILGGKQAAILVPTTVLAQQHYLTALRRFAGYPVRVEMLSRFRSPTQVRETLKKLQLGQVDFIIGTHRLFQKDVRFKALGLLIVDEEQRFGVAHKERLKEMSRQIDVLTLTATPIPRTLNMALSGIRDMSTLDEAPQARYPVQTFVLEHDYNLLADAIRRELSRGGQVFYLHNRVESIHSVAARLSRMLEGVSIGVGHGKMKEEELSEVMRAMSEGEIQVLVCTTIIETGIDIPNANTLIIENADQLGLAQLHQIRGRVGRSNRHAYAYLTYKKGKALSEIATRRLGAIREFAEFGSGFKLAMRDLEIRGAGNVLGAEQSGHLMSVGYDMYLKLLEEAVLEEQGAPTATLECTADLPIAANIAQSYISHAGLRMDYYRRMAAIATEEEAQDIRDELIDRFGDLPDSVNALIRIARLRADAAPLGIRDISHKNNRLILKLAEPDFAKISRLCGVKDYKGKVLFSAGDDAALTVKTAAGADPLKDAETVVRVLASL